jgi:hypothetical protein
MTTFVGPAIRRPLDPNQDARNAEAVLKIEHPVSHELVNFIKCIHLHWSRVENDKCRFACEGFLITKNEDLIQRVKIGETLTWHLASTMDLDVRGTGKITSVRLTRDDAELAFEYKPIQSN